MNEFTTTSLSGLRDLLAAKAAAPPDPPKPNLSSNRPKVTASGTHKAADAAPSVVPAAPESSTKVVPSVSASTSRPRKRLPRAPKGTPRDRQMSYAKRAVSEAITLLAKIEAAERRLSESRQQPLSATDWLELPHLEANLPGWERRVRYLLAGTLPAVRAYLDELSLLKRAANMNAPKESESEHE